jgi:probable phosphoglycerate mutase
MAATTETRELEASPLPSWLRQVEAGTVNYNGPSPVRAKLEAAGVELIGMRHGESEANLARPPVLSGQSDVPLTPQGREQARQAAIKLYDELCQNGEYPVVYASPLSRAHDTALALAQLVKERDGRELPIHDDARLIEIGFGRYEMKTAPELGRDYPEFTHGFDSWRGPGNEFRHRFPGGESRVDVAVRAASLLTDIAAKHPGRRVLLVCHMETMVGLRTALGTSKVREGSLRADAQEIKNAEPLWLSRLAFSAPHTRSAA